MIINPEDYRPEKKGKSDKFSWNFYRYLRYFKGDVQVMKKRGKKFESKNLFVKPSWNSYAAGLKSTTYSYNYRIRDLNRCVLDKSYIDVTERFFEEYEKLGYCLLHPDHWGSSYTGWIETPKTRTCKVCGLKQRKRVKHIREEYWEDAV